MKEKTTTTWIGLIKVEALKGSRILGNDKMAFTNAVGLSQSKYQFRIMIKNKLPFLGLKLIRLEEAEPFSDRINNYTVSKDIIKAVKRLSVTNNVDFSIFHTFPVN